MGTALYKVLTPLAANGSTPAINVLEDAGPCRTFAVQAKTTGSPSAADIMPQGSLDGTDWYNLAAAVVDVTTAQIFFVVDKPVRYFRLTLSGLTGGTSPTVPLTVYGVE